MAPPPYCDFNFHGRVQLVPDSHLLFNAQGVELPNGENVLFPRLRQGGQCFAGIGHQSGTCWEWLDGQWHDRGPCEGPHAVIYDAAGNLVIVRETDGAPTGSQGWRYVDDAGNLVPAYLTYADPVRKIYEYTERGDITVGQGEDGLDALIRGRRVKLDTGDVRFVRFYRDGEQLAICYIRNHVEAKFLPLTVAQLEAMPTYEDSPSPQPEPEPDPMPEMPESLEDEVRAERAKYPTPLADVNDYAKILNAVAWKHRAKGWGLSVKPSGNHVMSPQGVYVAYDILHHKPTNTLWGCFSDSGVNWGLEDYHGDPDGRPWLAPMQPDGEPSVPDPGPVVPTPGTAELDQLRASVSALTQRQSEMNDVLTRFMEAAAERFGILDSRITNVEQKPTALPELVARGRVSLGFLGSKGVELPVVPK